ncbi:hypothetical protein [Clostridium magnum]|uniref:Uncharacterized protein n=1 Tax=Clostridium magnum DSM 2767 TaxID=1121326 RepID=A0A162QZ66_9CLOT|nr:hypothetical protein [Clostridium magnum]KZL89177.1 hypothetical protein CLMAG_53950 [Clostridium magnum DSM 2767]SHJ24629.1 hypothetical protein SAMN02745944_05599 [Clostridium magnum DSM 2767]
MEEYLKKLTNRIPKENKGYSYITNIEISIPILCLNVNAIKRKEVGLQLAEEIIMKLIDNDITTVCDIAEIMGLEEDVVNITIGMLYVKDLIIVTSGNCILTTMGKEVLKNLKEIRLEPENISPVYINLLNGEMYTDKFNNQVDKYGKSDNVLDAKIKVDKEYINKRFTDIRDIFNEQQKIYGASNLSQAQLYKIESIEEDKIHYLNIKSGIFKSKSGEEIEISSSKHSIVNQIQSDILEQIIRGKKFKYIFRNKNTNKILLDDELRELGNYNNEYIRELVNKFNKVNKDERQKIIDEFYKIYRIERALLDNELELIIDDLVKDVKEVKVCTGRLGDVIFNDEYMLPICKSIKKGTKVCIYYNFERDIKKSKSTAEKTFPEIKDIKIIEYKERFHNTIIQFDDSFQIETSYYDIKVLDGKYITKTISTLKNIKA